MSSNGQKKPGVNIKQLASKNKVPYDDKNLIIDVWANNLHEEMEKMMEIVDDYPYISMDTEFPGVVARPIGCFKNNHEYRYQTLKCNVDLLKIIQLGLTFCDEEGRLPPGTCTWQFNFKFNLNEDMYAQDSIDLLAKSGIDFKERSVKGIEVSDFAELLMTSGIVLNEDVRWISFHSGYDFGYLVKLLTCQALPKDQAEFHDLLTTYFPTLYDVKHLMRSCEQLKGGLQKVAEDLQLTRVGPQHQAGSDSLLTAAAFFTMKTMFFQNKIDSDNSGVLFGLAPPSPVKSHSSSSSTDRERKQQGHSSDDETSPSPTSHPQSQRF